MRPCHSFMISECIWQLICKTLQMYNPLNFRFRFTSAWGLRNASQLHSMQFSGILLDAYLPLMLGNAIMVPSHMKIPVIGSEYEVS